MFVVHDVSVRRIDPSEITVPSSPAIQIDVFPGLRIGVGKYVIVRSVNGGVVLCADIDVIGVRHIHFDGVHFGDRNIVDTKPRLTSVIGHI